jgi:excisionase family DNA binding protein
MQANALAFTRSEAAEALRVSLRTIDNLLASGNLRSRRIGRRILIPRCELERVLAKDAIATSRAVGELEVEQKKTNGKIEDER